MSRAGSLVVLASAWGLSLPLLNQLLPGHSYVVNHVLGATFLALLVLTVRPSRASMSLTLAAWPRALRRVALPTLLIGGSAVLARVFAERRGWLPAGTPAFTLALPAPMVVYVLLVAPFQEIAFRGIIQGAAREIAGGGARASALAVAVSTLSYATLHLPWGPRLTIGTLALGMVWGILAELDRNVVGVAVSHAFVGWFYYTALSMDRIT